MRTIALCALSALLGAGVVAWSQGTTVTPSTWSGGTWIGSVTCERLTPEAVQQIKEATKP